LDDTDPKMKTNVQIHFHVIKRKRKFFM